MGMKASELIKELENKIKEKGDVKVCIWNGDISNYQNIYSIYTTTGAIDCVALEMEDEEP